MSYDKTYSKTKNVFGENAEKILVDNISNINKEKRILDIGSGQGRNSIHLAEYGFSVDAIDPSAVAINELNKHSEINDFQINAINEDFNTFIPSVKKYSAILIFGLIQILSKNQLIKLLDFTNNFTEKGSLVFITAFGDKDPSFIKYKNEWQHLGGNYFSKNNEYRFLLKENEILDMFKYYKTIHHFEGWGKKHQHGDGIMQKHYMVEAVFQK